MEGSQTFKNCQKYIPSFSNSSPQEGAYENSRSRYATLKMNKSVQLVRPRKVFTRMRARAMRLERRAVEESWREVIERKARGESRRGWALKYTPQGGARNPPRNPEKFPGVPGTFLHAHAPLIFLRIKNLTARNQVY